LFSIIADREPAVWDGIYFIILILLKNPVKHFVNIYSRIIVRVEPGSHVEHYSLQYMLRKSAWRRIGALCVPLKSNQSRSKEKVSLSESATWN